jgi:rubrerythrin
MDEFNSVDHVLDFAVEREEEAARFYTNLAGKMEKPWMKEVFEQFAREEMGHKAKLLAIKEGKRMLPSQRKVLDLKMADYLVADEPQGEMDYQQALILAMKKEKAAFKLYTHLAEKVDEADLKATLLALAQEEAKHKLRFEVEYDDVIMAEN